LWPGVSCGLEFYPLGRIALLTALRRLGLRAGDAIALPAYYCESTLSVLREAGLVLRYADLGADLHVDEEAIALLCRDRTVKAMIHVHYFGFRRPVSGRLRQICARHDVAVIEDYGHSFLSFEPPGMASSPDCSAAYIFSMRKILPIPDGGGLIMSSAERRGRGNTMQPADIWSSIPFLLRSMTEWGCIHLGWPNPYGTMMGRLRRVTAEEPADSERGKVSVSPVQPSVFLQRFLRRPAYLGRVVEKRRRNYACLYAGLLELQTLVVPDLEREGCTPQVLPILTEHTESLLPYLRQAGIGAYPWPGTDMPLEVCKESARYPNAVGTNRRLICLPVHQDIREKHIDYMLATIRCYFGKGSGG